MNNVFVAPTEEGKFKVLINYIQEGIDYTSRELAEKEAQAIKDRFGKPRK